MNLLNLYIGSILLLTKYQPGFHAKMDSGFIIGETVSPIKDCCNYGYYIPSKNLATTRNLETVDSGTQNSRFFDKQSCQDKW